MNGVGKQILPVARRTYPQIKRDDSKDQPYPLLQKIPLEIIVHLLSYCEPGILQTWLEVNRQMRDLVLNNPTPALIELALEKQLGFARKLRSPQLRLHLSSILHHDYWYLLPETGILNIHSEPVDPNDCPHSALLKALRESYGRGKEKCFSLLCQVWHPCINCDPITIDFLERLARRRMDSAGKELQAKIKDYNR